eukprot:2513744-Prymnesium_polylepis.1
MQPHRVATGQHLRLRPRQRRPDRMGPERAQPAGPLPRARGPGAARGRQPHRALPADAARARPAALDGWRRRLPRARWQSAR